MNKSFKLIDQNDFAFSAHSPKENKLQMSFGNVSLLLTQNEFAQLKHHVQDTLKNIKKVCCPYCRDIVVNTTVSNMAFMFSLEELRLMHEIMVNTLMMIEVKHILNN